MILVCDYEKSAWAEALRMRIYKSGYPCAAVSVHEIKDCLPVRVMISSYDVFNTYLSRGPYDNIEKIVIGKGFVNSALHAVRAEDEEACLAVLKQTVNRLYGLDSSRQYPFGVLFHPDIFLSEKHFSMKGAIFVPPPSEYMIFKYLLAFADTDCRFRAEQIRAFCCLRRVRKEEREPNIAVHIFNLNKEARRVFGCPVIQSRRQQGYAINPACLS